MMPLFIQLPSWHTGCISRSGRAVTLHSSSSEEEEEEEEEDCPVL
jgi:hypothetical protein